MFSDAHTHLTGNPFGENVLNPKEIQEVLKKAKDKGIVLMVAASHDLSSAERVAQITTTEDIVYGALGLHPWIATLIDDSTYKGFLALAKKPKVIAISEIGLDDSRSRAPKEVQLQTLVQQLRLSKETGLPPMLHNRGYHREIIDVLRQEKPPVGAIHGFNGRVDELKEWLDLGYYVSIGRAVLRAEGQDLKAMVQQIPEERLFLETDGVARSKEGVLEGQERVIQVAQVVASWRGSTEQYLGEVTTKNLHRLLRI